MKTAIHIPDAPEPIAPYSQGVLAGNTLYISGQIGLLPSEKELDKGISIEEETHRVLKNIRSLVTAAGLEMSSVCKCTIFLSDMAYFPEVNAIYASYFSAPFPARECVAVKTLPLFGRVEISCIAYKA